MKSINFQEFHHIIEYLKSKIISAQLQEVYPFERGLVLGLYLHKSFWLVIDLSPSPMLLLYETNKQPVVKSQKPRPVTLFINSNLKNRPLVEIKYQPEWGRRALFYFSHLESRHQIEVILIPNNANIIVTAEEKKISWVKPQNRDFSAVEKMTEVEEFRSHQVLKEEWEVQFSSKNAAIRDEKKLWEVKNLKNITKKQGAIEKILATLEDNKEETYYKIGEFLKYNSLESLPFEWLEYVDKSKTKDWNRETVFNKAKGYEQKRSGAIQRIEKLKEEIKNLQNTSFEENQKLTKHKISPVQSATMALRKLELSQQAIAYMGKNAPSNMELLKKSQAWDLWFHLKDFPSAHVIVRRNKNYKLSNDEIVKVIEWMVSEYSKSKVEKSNGSFDVVYTECRYVKPIKGDRLGRVQFANEQNFLWKNPRF